MTWTTQKPTQPGWYWWRIYDDEPWQVVQVCVKGDRIFHKRIGSQFEIDTSKGAWSGPIKEPEEHHDTQG